MTFEEYLKKHFYRTDWNGHGEIDHILRCNVHDNVVEFYIHPANISGDTLSFKVVGDTLIKVN